MERFGSHFSQNGAINLISRPDCYILNDLSVDTHIGYSQSHMTIWLYGFMVIWLYGHMVKLQPISRIAICLSQLFQLEMNLKGHQKCKKIYNFSQVFFRNDCNMVFEWNTLARAIFDVIYIKIGQNFERISMKLSNLT